MKLRIDQENAANDSAIVPLDILWLRSIYPTHATRHPSRLIEQFELDASQHHSPLNSIPLFKKRHNVEEHGSSAPEILGTDD